jgi:hypothetical protein
MPWGTSCAANAADLQSALNSAPDSDGLLKVSICSGCDATPEPAAILAFVLQTCWRAG